MATKHRLSETYLGYITLNLKKGVSMDEVPKNDVTIEDNSIEMYGKIEKIRNGFQFSVNDKKFTLNYSQLKSIENHFGLILWKNWYKN